MSFFCNVRVPKWLLIVIEWLILSLLIHIYIFPPMLKIFLMFSMLISDVYIRPPVYIQHTRFSVLLQANIMTFVTCALTAFNESTPPFPAPSQSPFLAYPTPPYSPLIKHRIQFYINIRLTLIYKHTKD